MRSKLVVILAAALALRVALILLAGTYLHPVAWEYESIANNILHGKGFIFDNFLGAPYRSLTTPLYIYACVGIYALTNHSYFVILLMQSIFSLCLALVIFQIAKAMFGEKAAFLSAILVAFHPGFVYYDVYNLIPLSIDSFLIAAAVLLFMKVKERPSIAGMSSIGCLIGLGTLSRGIIGALLPFLSAYFILFTRHLLREKIKFVAVLAIATFVVISPWVIRNFIVHKEFVFISSTSGENFYRGNNPYALGTSLTADGRSVRDLWPKEIINKVYSLDEIGQKKFFEKEAKDFIKTDPVGFAKLYLKKVYYFWWFSPQSGSIYPKPYLAVYRCLYSAFLTFALVGIVLAMVFGARGVRENTWLIIFVFMAVFMTQSLFYVEGRHRWLIEPLLAIFAGYGMMEAYNFLSQRTNAKASERHA